MEAAAALLPDDLAAVLAGGTAYEKRIEASGRNSVFRRANLPPRSEGPEALAQARRSNGFFWISCDLVDVVRARTDLTFSGLDPSRPIDAPRVVLPRDVLSSSAYGTSAPYRIDLEAMASWDRGMDEAALVVSPRASGDTVPLRDTRLVAVRIQLVQVPIRSDASVTTPAEGKRRGARPGEHPSNGDTQRRPAIEEVMRLVQAKAHRSIRAALLAVVEIPRGRNPNDVIRPYQEQMRREHREWYRAHVRKGDS